ncbi:hypothetical protein N9Z01_02130 [Flavobacteriaceae bacterium]|nr:hypothetical protein [Flavobacteriaceae bacterium]
MFFYCLNVYPQYFFKEDLKGYLAIENKQIIPYEIYFECALGECSGYSISDNGGENETKSKIIGFVDINKNLINFQETEIIYTKADYSTFDEFCYVYFSLNIRLKNAKLDIREKGDFLGKFKDSTQCSMGSYNLTNIVKLEKKINSLQKKINKKIVKKYFGDSTIKNLNRSLDSLKLNISNNKSTITKKVELRLEETHHLFLQDVGKQDGDLISILTSKNKKQIYLTKELFKPNVKNIDEFKIIGINEGLYPTIPIRILIKDMNKRIFDKIYTLRLNDTLVVKLLK